MDDAYAFEKILDIEEGDCLFAIDFSPHSQYALQLLQYAGQRKAETILLTDKTSSPLSRCANEILVADVEGTSFFNSNVAPLFLLEYLAGRMAEKNMEQTKHRLNILEPYFDSHRAVKVSKTDVQAETSEKKENEK
ncbi:SIS domain protein [compost metagenome]